MSERQSRPVSLRKSAGAITADTLLAWCLLGWLGQSQTWSTASGVLPVTVWWSVKCVASRYPLPAIDRALLPWLGTLIWVLMAVATGHHPSVPAGALLVAAGTWGVWSAWIAHDHRTGDGAAHRSIAPTLAGQCMGLMMGTMWLAGQWCLGLAWAPWESAAWHVGLMAAAPVVVGAGFRYLPMLRTRRSQGPSLTTILAMLGCSALAMADTPPWHLAGMLTLMLAWALARYTGSHEVPGRWWIGPPLLLVTGWLAPTHGPNALQAVWAVMALLCLSRLVQQAIQQAPDERKTDSLSPTHHDLALGKDLS